MEFFWLLNFNQVYVESMDDAIEFNCLCEATAFFRRVRVVVLVRMRIGCSYEAGPATLAVSR
jgi:hypothetical protein